MSQQYIMVIDHEKGLKDNLIVCINLAISALGWEKLRIKDVSSTKAAEQFIGKHDVPIIFIGKNTNENAVFAMIRRVKEKQKRSNFILVTDKKEYIIHAIQLGLHLSGCITQKPDLDNVKEQLLNLWFPIENLTACCDSKWSYHHGCDVHLQ